MVFVFFGTPCMHSSIFHAPRFGICAIGRHSNFNNMLDFDLKVAFFYTPCINIYSQARRQLYTTTRQGDWNFIIKFQSPCVVIVVQYKAAFFLYSFIMNTATRQSHAKSRKLKSLNNLGSLNSPCSFTTIPSRL